MIAFHAVLALFSVVFFLGLLWPHRNRHSASAAFSGYFAKAMWITWIVVVTAYFLNIGIWLRYFVYLIVVVVVLLPILRRKKFELAIPRFERWKLPDSLLATVVLGGVVIAVIYLFQDYDLIFTKWDAVVQNNRWAIELVNRSYWHHTAYPIFIPGIWSFVYNIQGTTDVWVFAKLFAPLAMIMMLIYGLLLFGEGRKAMSVILVGSLALFALTLRDTIGDGYADAPVVIFVFFGYMLVFDALRESNSVVYKEKFLFAFLILGIAAAMKQVGALSLMPVLGLLVYLLWARRISFGQFLVWGITLSIPLILFLLVFQFQFQDKEHLIFGNILNLTDRTARSLISSTFITAANRLFNYFHPILVILVAMLGLLSVKIRQRAYLIIGVVSLVFVPFGFVFYAKCCSYEARNGFWLMALLLLSGISFFIYHFDHRLSLDPNFEPIINPRRLSSLFFVLSLFCLLFGLVISPEMIANNFSSDGILDLETISEINFFRWAVISGGIVSVLTGAMILFVPDSLLKVGRWTNDLFRFPEAGGREVKIPGWGVSISIVLILLIIPTTIANVYSDSELISLQDTHQADVGSSWGLGLVLENLEKMGDTGLLLSRNQPLAYNPALEDRFALCAFKSDGLQKCTYWREPGNSATYDVICSGVSCVDTIVNEYPNSMFLARKANVDTVLMAFSESDAIEVVNLGGGDYVLLWMAPIEK